MNKLNIAIKEAFESSGSSKEANKVYLEFIKANFIIPIESNSDDSEPRVLFWKKITMFFCRYSLI